MKNTMKLMASLSLAASLVSCGPAPNEPKTSNSSTPSAAAPSAAAPSAAAPSAAAPSAAAPTAAPSASANTPAAMPTSNPSALPTPPPDPKAAFSLSTASAVKNPDFSYNVTIAGVGMGTFADYKFFQVEFSEATIPVIVNGTSKVGQGDLIEGSLTATELKFRFKFANPPVKGDRIKLRFEKNAANDQISTEIRLDSVTN